MSGLHYFMRGDCDNQNPNKVEWIGSEAYCAVCGEHGVVYDFRPIPAPKSLRDKMKRLSTKPATLEQAKEQTKNALKGRE